MLLSSPNNSSSPSASALCSSMFPAICKICLSVSNSSFVQFRTTLHTLHCLGCNTSAPYHIRRLGCWMEAMCYVCSRLQQLFEVSPWGMQLGTVPLCVVMGDVSTIRIPQPPPYPHYLHVSTYPTLNNAQGHRSGDTNVNRIFSIDRRIHPYPLQQGCTFFEIIFDSLVYWLWFKPIVCACWCTYVYPNHYS